METARYGIPQRLRSSLGALCDAFVPQAVHDLGPDAVRRARIIMTFWLVMLPWPPIFAAVYQFAIGLPMAALICLGAWAIIGVVPVVLWKTGSILWAGNVAVADLVAALILLALQTGGLQAPALTWLCVIPLTAICMAGRRSGIAWTCIVLVQTVAFYWATNAGWLSPSSMTLRQHDLLVTAALAGLQLAIFSLGAMYEAQKEWTLGLVLRREQALAQALSDMEQTAGKLASANADLQREIAERQEVEAALRESEAQCREAKEVAEASSRIKSEFLANMSHEIRTPMTAILGYLDLVSDQCSGGCPHGPDALRDNLKTVRRNGEHLLQVISDILDLSKIEAGRLEVEPVECSMTALLAEVEAVVKVSAAAKGLAFRVTPHGPLPATIRTDPTRLRQVLLNLLSNAVKFTESGRVDLDVRLTEARDTRTTGPMLRFEVSDTGIGMQPGDLGRLFQPFSQLQGSTNRKYGGTGLGLAISSRLAEKLGGRIEVRSEYGKGSTFCLTIAPGPLEGVPLLPGFCSPAAGVPAAPPPPCQLHGRRILLAEDGPDNQRLISAILAKAGAEVTIAENGRIAADRALEARAEGRPFELILMDMQMPEMDGYSATRFLRNEGYRGPIIAVTAHAMVTDRQKCLDAGCDDYASKPIDRQALIRRIAEHLERASNL